MQSAAARRNVPATLAASPSGEAAPMGSLMHQYDKSSKWLIQHHGDSILRLAGVADIVSWQPLQAELVQPRRLPDGLLMVRHVGEEEPDHYVLEIATYPDARVADQVVHDTALVFLDRRVLPEVVVLFLHAKGNVDAAGSASFRSRRGCAGWHVSWRTVKLWEVSAVDLLAAGDIGLVPGCRSLGRAARRR
jgi:hypothetical protein